MFSQGVLCKEKFHLTLAIASIVSFLLNPLLFTENVYIKFTVVMDNPNLWVLNITILGYSQIREK